MTATITEPGVYDLPADVYHADPVPGGSLSQSGAKLLLPPSVPALYKYEREHPRTPSKVMNLGTAAHAAVLGVGRPVVAVPAELLSDDGGVRSKAAREWRTEAIAAGKTVVTQDEADTIKAMAEALRSHPVAGPLLAREGKAEQAMFWRDERTGIWRRGMVDWLPTKGAGRTIITDYKTARSAAPEAFSKAVAEYGYHIQSLWYRQMVDAVLDDPEAAFVFIVQETTAPYLVGVYEANPNADRIAHVLIRRAIDIYRRCTETGVWPGYSTDVEPVALPYWVERQYEMELTA